MVALYLARKGRKAIASSRGFATVAMPQNLADYSCQIIPFPLDGIKNRFGGYFSLEVRGKMGRKAKTRGKKTGDFFVEIACFLSRDYVY